MGYPTQQQKVDFVFKKLGFTKAKTGVAEDQTSGFSGDTKKAPPNEELASPLVVPASSVWADSQYIPTSPPTSSTAYVGIYTAANAYRMTYDKTVANERTFVARSTAGSQSASIDGNWIDTQFGADYLVKVYKGDPDAGGTNVGAAGSGADDTWFFDYSAGILNFNGEDDVAGVGTDNIYILGYRYLGTKGLQPPAGMGTFHNLYVSGVSTFVGNVFEQSSVQIGLGLSVAGISTFTGDIDANADMELAGNLAVVGVSTFTGNIDANAGLDVDGTSDLDQVNIAQGLNVTAGISTFAGDIDANADIELAGNIAVTGVSTFTGDIDANADIELAGNIAVTGVSTFTGDIDANADIELAGNIAVTGVSTFTGDIDANGNLDVDGRSELDNVNIAETLNVVGISTFNNNIKLANEKSINLGTNKDIVAGATGISIDAYGSQNITIKTNAGGGASGKIQLQAVGGEESIVLNPDAGVQIYYDNSLRLDTTGYGVSITGGTSGIGTLGGPATFHIDPAAVGDNTGTVVIKGNLQVDGTQTTVNSTTMTVDDKNIVLGQGAANDAAADGGGITLESSAGGNKTWNWVDSTDSWTSSENIDIASGKYLSFAGDTNTHISHPLADTLIVTTAGTERLRVRNDGNVHFVNNASIAGILTVTGDIDADGDIELAGNLAVTGISTFTGDIDANADIELAGNLAVTGVSTFTGNIDANGALDVDGQTDLDVTRISEGLNVTAGIATFAADIDANADVDIAANLAVTGVSTFTGDIDANADIELAGNIAVTGVSTFTGDIDANADIELAGNLAVTGVSTFTNNIDANAGLDVDGTSDLDQVNIADGLNVTAGIATFAADIDANADMELAGNLAVVGVSTFSAGTVKVTKSVQISENLNVSGITTFSGAITLPPGSGGNFGNINIAVTGNNEIDTDAGTGNLILDSAGGTINIDDGITVAGVSTFTGDIDANADIELAGNIAVTGVSTFTGDIDANADIELAGNLAVTGLSTFTGISKFDGDIDANADIELAGNLAVTGVSTFTGDIDANADIDVAANLNVSGVTTTTTFNVGTNGQSGLVGITTILDEDNMASNSATALVTQQSIKAYVDTQITAEDLDFAGDSGTGAVDLDSQSLTVAGTSNEIETSASGQTLTIGLPDDVTIGDDLTVTGDIASVTNVNVTGVSTFAGDIDANADIELAGNIAVTGVSTFTGNIDANAGLDVDGTSDLDQVNIAQGLNVTAGIATFAGDIDANADIELAGNIAVTGVSTFTGAIDANGALDVDGTSDLDQVNISDGLNVTAGIATFAADIDANADIEVAGNIAVTGVSTFIGETNIGTGGTVFTALVGAAASVGIGSALPDYMLDVSGAINSETDVKISGTSVLTSALNEAVAMAIALG